MAKLVTVCRHAPSHVRGLCKVEAAVVSTSSATEIYARCAPLASGNSRNGCHLQTQAIYESLSTMLSQLGAAMGHVAIEKVFLRSVAADFHAFQEARLDAYRRHGISGHRLPAATYVGQPPCAHGQDVELQVYAVVPTTPGSARVHSISPANEHATVKLIEIGEARHLYVGNLSGEGRDHGPLGPIRGQSNTMFDTAQEILAENGASYRDVLRARLYLDEIDRDYQALSDSRSDFFGRTGVERPPVGTALGGKLHPRGTLCTLDAYALLSPQIAQIELLPPAGMKMALPELTYLFVSATAAGDDGAAVPPATSGPNWSRCSATSRACWSRTGPPGATWSRPSPSCAPPTTPPPTTTSAKSVAWSICRTPSSKPTPAAAISSARWRPSPSSQPSGHEREACRFAAAKPPRFSRPGLPGACPSTTRRAGCAGRDRPSEPGRIAPVLSGRHGPGNRSRVGESGDGTADARG